MGIIRGTLLGKRGFYEYAGPVTAIEIVVEKASTGKWMEDLKAVAANAEDVKADSVIF